MFREMSKPAEINAIKKDFRKAKVRFALCYPSTYRVGMSSLATHLLYGLVNEIPYALCERFFYSFSDQQEFSVESSRPLRDFTIIGFSFQYELDYVNALHMLMKSNIPLKSSERSSEHQLVIAGGPSIASNPMPMTPFFDVIVIGEAENLLPKIIDIVSSYDKPRDSLEEISKMKGVFIPQIHDKPIEKALVEDLNNAFYPTAQVLSVDDERKYRPVFEKSFLLEVSRGCPKGCRFCLESFLYRPYRERKLDRLIEILEEGLSKTPAKKVVCIGSAFAMHSRFNELLEVLLKTRIQLSIPSIWPTAINDQLVKLLLKGGQRTLTMAPETTSSRLQMAINKNFFEEDYYQAIKIAVKGGVKQLKLYFMLGLPGEKDDDVAAIARFLNNLVDLGFNRSRAIRVSINPFIPKAWTPFQWANFIDEKSYKTRCLMLRKLIRKPQIEISCLNYKWALIQAILSIGGAELSPIIQYVAENRGRLSAWRKALKKYDLDFKTLSFKARELKPWTIVDLGVSEDFLKKEFEKALDALKSG
mgnify:CR=1 FL=1